MVTIYPTHSETVPRVIPGHILLYLVSLAILLPRNIWIFFFLSQLTTIISGAMEIPKLLGGFLCIASLGETTKPK